MKNDWVGFLGGQPSLPFYEANVGTAPDVGTALNVGTGG